MTRLTMEARRETNRPCDAGRGSSSATLPGAASSDRPAALIPPSPNLSTQYKPSLKFLPNPLLDERRLVRCQVLLYVMQAVAMTGKSVGPLCRDWRTWAHAKSGRVATGKIIRAGHASVIKRDRLPRRYRVVAHKVYSSRAGSSSSTSHITIAFIYNVLSWLALQVSIVAAHTSVTASRRRLSWPVREEPRFWMISLIHVAPQHATHAA